MSAQNHHNKTPASTPHPQQQPMEPISQNPPTHHHIEAQFEKNYPKNLFIPIIQYLTELGYKQAYEKCVGCKSQFQGKNVVSLSSIYTLITQDWFRRNINNENLLAHISNKILLNSKIKKKLFHLLIAQMILMVNYPDLKDFKRRVSKQANMIARKALPTDDLFDYPNAIIYLLHLFLKILLFHANKKGYNKMEDQISKNNFEEQFLAESKNKNQGSKEEYKAYVKDIVHIFSGKGLSIHNLNDILEQAKQNILDKDRQLRQKYQLIDGIPKWTLFNEIVIMRCFQYKRKDMKITNFLFNQWTNQFKSKILNVFDATIPQTINTKETAQSQWQAVGMKEIEMMTKNLNFSSESWSALPQMSMLGASKDEEGLKQGVMEDKQATKITVKQFSPIILSSFIKK